MEGGSAGKSKSPVREVVNTDPEGGACVMLMPGHYNAVVQLTEKQQAEGIRSVKFQ